MSHAHQDGQDRAGGTAYDIVFLDRDGTLNRRIAGGYVCDPADLVLLPGAGRAVARLCEQARRVIIVTNQRGLATGALTWDQFEAVSLRLKALVVAAGGRVDATYVCPHEHGTCDCRKPAPGLFERALRAEAWADPARCVMIGDMRSDVEPALALGMQGVLLGADAADLGEAVDLLLGGRGDTDEDPSG